LNIILKKRLKTRDKRLFRPKLFFAKAVSLLNLAKKPGKFPAEN